MKKNLRLTRLVLCLCAVFSSTTAFAAAGWLGAGAIYIDETFKEGVSNGWYYTDQQSSTNWCEGGAFEGANLGTLTSLTLSGQVQLWDESNADWGSGATAMMYYSIDGGAAQLITMNYYKFQNNNNFFQPGGDPMVSTVVSLTGLEPGLHTLAIYFDDYDSKKTTSTYTAYFYTPYTRTVTSGNYGTICLPFNATISGATLYTIASKTANAINLNEVGTTLTAGQAYIFKATGSELSATLSGSYTDAATGGALVGNVSATPVYVALNKYVISENKVKKVVGDAVTCGQYRAYIDLDKVSTAGARGAHFLSFNDEATDIENIQAKENQNVVYNLQGQRVMNGQKGMFIVNGKKVIRK